MSACKICGRETCDCTVYPNQLAALREENERLIADNFRLVDEVHIVRNDSERLAKEEMGYVAECERKGMRIAELEAALREILHDPWLGPDAAAWYRGKAAAALGEGK